ncbi:hypothetical protein PHET_03481 [Paragonimus heterotremus]|uniref:C2 NT-type domain-containing protein n=1 Tax=Paragonimus heterotremus TaxID=100268 RepID=A0A8J4SR24_9TREM|nr:hypothetical protein PHET_03481 [Paragonimus heterotremus]
MACVPILNRRKGYQFEAIVKLHSLISVPYVNAVTFAKLRLLNARHSSQYSPRVEIRNHTVTWNTEHRFLCRFRSNMETTILEPNILKISIRMETKGGKSFYKVGFVSVDLACFTALGDVTSRRRYILEGYNEKHKRLDNSLLLVSFSMRQLFGDTCFRAPPENLSNCLIEPPDSDESDSVLTGTLATDPPDTMDRTLVNPTVNNPLLGSDIALLTNSTQPSSCIDRILESIHVTTTTDPFPVQPYRPSSARSPIMGAHLPNLSKQIPIADILRDTSALPGSESDPLHPPFQPQWNTIQTQSQLHNLFNKVSSSSEPAIEPYDVRVNFATFDMTTDDVAFGKRQQGLSQRSTQAETVATEQGMTSASSAQYRELPADEGSSVRIPASCDSGTPNLSPDVSPTVIHSDLPPTSNSFFSSGSNSVTPTSASSTPGSTPTSSLVILHPHLAPPNHPASKAELNEPHASTDTKLPHDSIPVEVEPAYCNAETTGTGDCLDAFPHTLCHSLPFPAHHSRRRCDALPMHSEYFATDSGLLLPSRRRKSRPMANLAFSQSAYRVGQTHSPLSSLSSGAFTYQSDVPADASQNDSEPEHPAGCVVLGGCPSTGGESRSSGYQSHSRQSSLESQAVGLNTAMNPTIVPLPPVSSGSLSLVGSICSDQQTDLVSVYFVDHSYCHLASLILSTHSHSLL